MLANETGAVARKSVFFEPKRTSVLGRVSRELVADVLVVAVERKRKGGMGLLKRFDDNVDLIYASFCYEKWKKGAERITGKG